MSTYSVAELSGALQAWERHCAAEKTKFIEEWVRDKRKLTKIKEEGLCTWCEQKLEGKPYIVKGDNFCDNLCFMDMMFQT